MPGLVRESGLVARRGHRMEGHHRNLRLGQQRLSRTRLLETTPDRNLGLGRSVTPCT